MGLSTLFSHPVQVPISVRPQGHAAPACCTKHMPYTNLWLPVAVAALSVSQACGLAWTAKAVWALAVQHQIQLR